MKPLRIATRGSELALWQARFIASQLGCEAELVIVSTGGDQDQTSSLDDIGGQGVFVKEVQAAVIENRADIAVHSAKDLPTQELPGLVVGAFPRRGDVRDALVGRSFEDLSVGDTVATGSMRRRVQLAAKKPGLNFVSIRGNMATRIKLAEKYSSVVVAYAALERLGLLESVSHVFEPTELIPQVGQGSLAVECRTGDELTQEILMTLDDAFTRRAVESERSLLRELGSGCSLPVGAYATVDSPSGRVNLTGFIGSPEGTRIIKVKGSSGDHVALGARLGKELFTNGGGEILARLTSEKER